jgi:hypothetical protein
MIDAGGGSIGIAGAARSVLMAYEEKDDQKPPQPTGYNILCGVKSNWGPKPRPMTYSLEFPIGGPASRVRWEHG